MFEYRAKVIRVVDGDTVDLNVDLGFGVWREDRFRLYGLDAPEKGAPGGAEATKQLYLMLQSGELSIVTVKDKQDKYGRYLAVLFIGELNINEQMVRDNFAKERYYKRAQYYGNRKTVDSSIPTSVDGELHGGF